ncbi:MAG: hypothetical protein GX675_06275 [Erysipelotrichaceae bacterium]|nr:hypothetical protein [Erysipelotrichaceae bacterium]
MKKILSIILKIIIICLFLGLNFLAVKFYSEYKLHLVRVYVASHNISGRHLIVEEDIDEIVIPYVYINDKAYLNKDDIIGKYTDIQGKIPVGSLFYKTMLFDKSELNDNPILELKVGQTLFTFQTDVLALSGNSIVRGHRVDIYGSLNIKQDNYIQDLLVSDVRVISIKDNKGYDIDHPNSNKIPFIISLAIDNSSLKYLSLLSKIGNIEIYPSLQAYSTTNEAKLNEKSILLKYLNSNQINDIE